MRIVAGRRPSASAETIVGSLREEGKRYDCLVQGIDGRYVAGETHLRTAVELARRAHDRGTAIADDLAMETLLYAAGTRQIDRALETGIGPETESIVVVVDGAEESVAADAVEGHLDGPVPDVGERDAIRDWFDIPTEEVDATDATLEELVCERVVLLQLDA